MKFKKIHIRKHDKNTLEITCKDIKTLNFIEKRFSIHVKGYEHIEAVQQHRWDGKVKFFKENLLSIGLLSELLTICRVNEIPKKIYFKISNKLNYDKVKNWIDTKLNIPFKPREFQYKIAFDTINNFRITAESVTGSGKSLAIYLVIRFMLKQNLRTILIVPNIPLLYQMLGDFKDYGWKDADKYVQLIGDKFIDKEFKKPIIVTTWQSLYAKRKKFYRKITSIRSTKLRKINRDLEKKQLENVNKDVSKEEALKIVINHLSKKDNNYKENIKIIQRIDYQKNIIKKHLLNNRIDDIKSLIINKINLFHCDNDVEDQITEFEKHIKKEFNTIDTIIGDECDGSASEALLHIMSM